MLDGIRHLLDQAGVAGVLLVFTSLALWTTVALRAAALWSPYSGNLDAFVDAALGERPLAGSPLLVFVRRLAALLRQRGGAEDHEHRALLQHAEGRLGQGRQLLTSLVVVAPLLGLLGTVNGMTELFRSLHGPSSSVVGSSVASGISTALVSTQLGLLIGASGLVVSRLLLLRERRLRRELHAAKRLVAERFQSFGDGHEAR